MDILTVWSMLIITAITIAGIVWLFRKVPKVESVEQFETVVDSVVVVQLRLDNLEQDVEKLTTKKNYGDIMK